MITCPFLGKPLKQAPRLLFSSRPRTLGINEPLATSLRPGIGSVARMCCPDTNAPAILPAGDVARQQLPVDAALDKPNQPNQFDTQSDLEPERQFLFQRRQYDQHER